MYKQEISHDEGYQDEKHDPGGLHPNSNPGLLVCFPLLSCLLLVACTEW